MKNALISVIVPVYNIEQYLLKCADSLLNQTYTNLEIILVDDGSLDKSPMLCDELAAQNPRVRVIHQTNQGVSHARNVGIDHANGQFITFVDSDDFIELDMIESLYSLLLSSQSDIATCEITFFTEGTLPQINNKENSTMVLSGKEAIKNILYQKSIINGAVAKLFDKRLFDNTRFSEDITIAEDLELNYRLFSKAKRIAVTSAQKYHYLQRINSATRSQFSLKRMQGLSVILSIYKKLKPYKSLKTAAENRLFAEAIFIAVDIPYLTTQYNIERQECLSYIKKMAKTVKNDAESKSRFRLYATISTISAHALIIILKTARLTRRFILRNKRKKGN